MLQPLLNKKDNKIENKPRSEVQIHCKPGPIIRGNNQLDHEAVTSLNTNYRTRMFITEKAILWHSLHARR